MFNRSSATQAGGDGIALLPYEERPPREPGPGVVDAFRTGLEISGAKPSIISEQFVLVGNIKAPGDLHIEGTVRGDLEVASAIIGAGGLLEGSVVCTTLQIRGQFRGRAVCRNLLVASTAQVDAEIAYQELTVQRGARMRGRMRVEAGRP